MGSYHDTCEIVELKEDLNSVQHSHAFHQIDSISSVDEKDRKPVLKLGYPLEDDLNKIFAAIILKPSFEGLSPRYHFNAGLSKKNAQKQPFKADSLGIESPEPATLKQALRGLCVSQASEMAAMKRLSKSNSNYLRISDATRRRNSYRPIVDEQNEDDIVLGKGKVGIPANSHSPSNHSEKKPQHLLVPKIRLSAKNVTSPCSMASTPSPNLMPSPHATSKSLTLNAITIGVIQREKSKPKMAEKEKIRAVHSPNCSTITTDNILDIDLSIDKATHRLGKPVLKDKIIAPRKKKQDSHFTPDTSSNGCYENPSTSKLVCQRCNRALKNSDQTSPAPKSSNPDTIKPCSGSSNSKEGDAKKAKTMEILKSSQSSKSSLGENSTSTSISEESNLSRPSCGNRPHMSKDVRWKAIRRARIKHGVLGLDHFNLVRKLGCGDIGTVYLAELVDSNCLFAIKVMDNEYLERRKKLPRAQTEREILKILDHPFLPTLYVHFTSDDLSCLVMEYCPGGDLHVLRQRQPGRNFPEQVAKFYAAEVLLALEYLHMLGVVYRDLKPENILVRADGHIMLTDFDLSLRCSVNPTLIKSPPPPSSKIAPSCTASTCIDPFCIEPTFQAAACFLPRKTIPKKPHLPYHLTRSAPQLVAEPTSARSNSFVGTHEYLAPEIIKGEGHGSAVDWWTFGVFLYELLYGRTPFKGCGNEETLGNVVLQGLRFPSSPLVSLHARDLIKGLLVKEPEMRLGWERGASEIKRHPFFDGLNWALIRCEVPPEIPEAAPGRGEGFVKKKSRFLEMSSAGHLGFETF